MNKQDKDIQVKERSRKAQKRSRQNFPKTRMFTKIALTIIALKIIWGQLIISISNLCGLSRIR